MRHASRIILAVSLFALAACGGGGGDMVTEKPQLMKPAPKPMIPTPKPMMPDRAISDGAARDNIVKDDPLRGIELHARAFDGDLTEGTASSLKNARSSLRELRESGDLARLQSFALQPGQVGSLTDSNLFCPNNLPPRLCVRFGDAIGLNVMPQATQDTQAETAWAQGWTGEGVKIGIVDDFRQSKNHKSDPSQRSHGYFTRGIALQVAPEADVHEYEVADRTGGLYRLLREEFDEAEADKAFILNISFGIDYFLKAEDYRSARSIQNQAVLLTRDTNYIKLTAAASKADTYDPKMLFVFAAGNGAQGCQSHLRSRHLDVCTLEGASLSALRESDVEAGDRTIFVGSLKDDTNLSEITPATRNSDNYMADYSYQAGKLKYDFLVAHDDVWNSNTAGTSYAAPRVTGAAALVRHKFPNLNGPQLKQVLLQTATDLGADGPDEVYGYGALNVMSALSPILDENGKFTK